MKLLTLTLPTPEENLALDEALLDKVESGQAADEVLRLWEMPRMVVVVGRSSRVDEEVNLDAAEEGNVPILRRCSGGAAIAAGPGCLMYSVVLHYQGREHLRMLDQVHRHVLGLVRTVLQPFVGQIEHAGTSDLAIAGRKFSGNSLRCKHDYLLYHGTILYALDLTLIGRLLKMPPRQPGYRAFREHAEFVTNLPITANSLRAAIATAFQATETMTDWPRLKTAELVQLRYNRREWNFER